MKKSRFTEEKVVRILAQAGKGERSITEICREHGISQATFYNWRKRFRGMSVAEVKELKQLRRENARLKGT